ncbi:unnamed protein product [Miscanthus lutarioriparius]|uniref:Uncharacterized protein n=1 Tax=Miscanthus lutarioriparius TaxID=422564 RepID=A0A811S8V3_9POAL|nr:unnamed protein product [Miscanthus lutarioriparius]
MGRKLGLVATWTSREPSAVTGRQRAIRSLVGGAPVWKLVAAAPKPNPKVEDGILGTSGGIGFTKENELFVGRVAMLGFAASLLGEAITGKGILAQLNLETGIPIYEAEPLLLFFILFTLLGAIGALGDRGRFVDEEVTGLDKAVIQPGKGFRGALGLSKGGPLFGFTKSNELFVGRLAQLGVAFSIIGEIITGKGALAQLNIETGGAHQRDRATRHLQRPLLFRRRHQPRHRQVHHRRRQRRVG